MDTHSRPLSGKAIPVETIEQQKKDEIHSGGTQV